MEKAKWLFHFSDGVNPGRPDDIRPYRPSGRIFHAMHEISGLAMMSRKAEEELLRAGSIGEVGSAYVEDFHFGSSQRLALFLT
jgi:hypothetical protein